MALTNYLCQTLIGTTIFYGHGLGWYGYLSRAQLQEPMSVPARKGALQPFRHRLRQFGRIVRLREQQVAVRRQHRR